MKRFCEKILAGLLAAIMAAGMLASLGAVTTLAEPDITDPGNGYKLNYPLVDKIKIIRYDDTEDKIPEDNKINFGVKLRVNIREATLTVSSGLEYPSSPSYTMVNSPSQVFGAWQYYDEDAGQWFTYTDTMTRYEGTSTVSEFIPSFDMIGKYIRFMVYDERLEKQGKDCKFVSVPVVVEYKKPSYKSGLVSGIKIKSLSGKQEDDYMIPMPGSNEVLAGEPLRAEFASVVEKLEPSGNPADPASVTRTHYYYSDQLVGAWQYYDMETASYILIEDSGTYNSDSIYSRFLPSKELTGKKIRFVLFDTRLDVAYCTDDLYVKDNLFSYGIGAFVSGGGEVGTVSILGGTYINENNVLVNLGDSVIIGAYPKAGYKFEKWTLFDLEHNDTDFEGNDKAELTVTLDIASHKSYYAHFKGVGVSKFAAVKDINGNDSVESVSVNGLKVGENFTRNDYVGWSIYYKDGYEITKAELVFGSNRLSMALSKDETKKMYYGSLQVPDAAEFSIEVTSKKTEETPETPEPPADPSDLFSDIGGVSAGVKKAIGWAVDNGIIKGFSDGTFRPDDSTTRQQFTIMLWRMAGKPVVESENPFSDVDTSMPGYKAIMWAVDQGIIKGFDDGTFGPDQNLKRNQIVIMLWRMLDRPEGPTEQKFPDVTPSMSEFKAVQWAAENGIVNGFGDGTFGPEKECTRAQIVVMLYRLVDKGFVTLP